MLTRAFQALVAVALFIAPPAVSAANDGDKAFWRSVGELTAAVSAREDERSARN